MKETSNQYVKRKKNNLTAKENKIKEKKQDELKNEIKHILFKKK